MRVVTGLFLALLAGCAAPARPRPSAVVRIERAAAHGPAPAAASPGEGVQVELPPGTLHCGASAIVRCDLSVPLTVTNLGARAVTVTSIELVKGDIRVRWEPGPGALARGERLVQTLREFSVGTEQVVVHYRAGPAGPTHSIARVVNVDNPELERRRAACRACSGDWGAHGITGYEGCNCRMRDAGKECRDGTDCQGECLFDHTEEVRPAARHCSRGACAVTMRAVRLVGRCATFRTTFGCHSYIPDGESKRPPRIGPGAPFMCVD